MSMTRLARRHPAPRLLALWRPVPVALLISLALACCREQRKEALTVFAASSLTEVLQAQATAFESSRNSERIQFYFSGSQVLRLQIENGAMADLFLSADEEHALQLKRSGFAQSYRTIALNELVVIVPVQSKLTAFKDLPQARSIVLGVAGVPVGRYARQILKNANKIYRDDFEQQVLSHVVSEETNVRLVRTRVELGSAEAALVYRTDAIGREALRIIDIPAGANVQAACYGVRLKQSTLPDLAQAFLDHLTSQEGAAIFERHGFLKIR